MININNRLKTVASFVLESDAKFIIDVGCDHALLDIYLFQCSDKLKIVASDINEGPLLKAEENLLKYSCFNKIKLEKADGISNINDNTDTIIISGMGMENIIKILTQDKSNISNVKRLIISSNNKYEILRFKICNLGFYINKEKIIYEDGKYYIIIEFIKGNSEYTKKEFYFGPCLLKNKDKLFYEYYLEMKNIKEQILNSIPIVYKEKRKLLIKEIKMLILETS